jgi:hypothetical protein
VIVERDAIPYAVMISPEQFTALRMERIDDWEIIGQIAAQNSDINPDAVLAELTAAVEEARQESYEGQKRSTPRRPPEAAARVASVTTSLT